MNHYLCEAKIEEISIQRKEMREYIGNIKEEPEYDIDLALYIALAAAETLFNQGLLAIKSFFSIVLGLGFVSLS